MGYVVLLGVLVVVADYKLFSLYALERDKVWMLFAFLGVQIAVLVVLNIRDRKLKRFLKEWSEEGIREKTEKLQEEIDEVTERITEQKTGLSSRRQELDRLTGWISDHSQYREGS